MHRLAMALAAPLLFVLSLSACTSLDEVREQPVQWKASYLVPFDTLASCIAARLSQHWATTPQIYTRQGFAYVTLADKSAPSIVAEFFIRQQSDGSSLVEWRRRPLLADYAGLQSKSHEAADRCAESEAASASGSRSER